MVGLFIRIMKFGLKAGIVIAGIAILISYARLSEFGDMRKDLMDRIYKSYAGRLSINGPVELNVSFPPSISIGDVRISNSDWGKKPDMLRARQVVAEIDLLPLLQGEMAVPRLRMIGVDIIVERKRDGTTNWDELNEFETAAGPNNPAAVPSILPSIGGAVVSVVGGTLTVLDPFAATATIVSLGGGIIGGGGGLVPCL